MLCSLCVCNGVAVRSNQNLITENLLPGRDLLLQTNIINYATRWGYFLQQQEIRAEFEFDRRGPAFESAVRNFVHDPCPDPCLDPV